MPKIFLFLIFFVATICLGTNHSNDFECDDLAFKYEFIENDDDSYSLELEISGGLKPYIVNVVGDNRSKNRLGLKTNIVNNLKEGSYIIIIQDANGCRKQKKTVID